MSDTINSSNMSLPVPIVGQDAGPQWATDINSCMAIIDGHSHVAGSGVPITPSAMSINSDLTFANNQLTNAKTLGFFVQVSTPATLNAFYVSGVDAYFNDGSGNHIRITQGGAVTGASGTITGLPSGTASAAFGSGVFTFQASTNTPANIDGGSFVFRNNSANSKGLTLSPPAAMGADFSIVLPALPGSGTKFVSLDSSGNMGATWAVDNSTLQVSGSTVQVKDGGITNAKLAAVSYIESSSSGSFSTSSTTYTTVNIGVTLVTTGRPVFIGLISDGGNSFISGQSFGSSGFDGKLKLVRNATTVHEANVFMQATGATNNNIQLPVSIFSQIDIPSAGSNAYTLFAKVSNAAFQLGINSAILIAYEL